MRKWDFSGRSAMLDVIVMVYGLVYREEYRSIEEKRGLRSKTTEDGVPQNHTEASSSGNCAAGAIS